VAIDEVQPRIYRIPSVLGPRRFAQWVVVGDERLLLVDSGIDGTVEEHVVPALAELDRTPDELTDVVISHADVDHYGGNAALRRLAPRARIRAHQLDRPLVESWAVISRERYGWYRGYGLDYDEATWRWLEGAAGPDTPIDGTVAEGEALDLGGISVEVVDLPGHSPGHLGVVHAESGTAIVMDAVLARGLLTVDDELIGPPPYASVAAYRGTIERLRALRPARLGTSHYAPVEGRSAVEGFLDDTEAFVDGLDACVRSELGPEPRPLEHYRRVADGALGPFPEMGVELARSVAAHLDAAVETGAAVRRDGVGGIPAWSAG
jgi:glyoxylase-like metal-dependent hydrolase (beta-lactamase superfamily II)